MKEQGRYQHPECRWKDVSCVKSLMTKKAHDQRRLEKAIRNTPAGAAGAAGSAEWTCGNAGVKPGLSSRGGSSSSSVEHGDENGEEVEAERTELEIATEAAVVRGKGVGRQARKELRESMSRYDT